MKESNYASLINSVISRGVSSFLQIKNRFFIQAPSQASPHYLTVLSAVSSIPTLNIGPVKNVIDDSIIAPPGIYNAQTRTITWFVGEVGPGEGGYAEFSINLRNDAPDGTEVINYGTVYFPSVPEETRTNGIVSVVGLDTDDDGLTDDIDNCPYVSNLDQTNSDNDSYGDVCDNCPDIDNEDQFDSDGNGEGDACENENAPPIAEAGTDHTTECTGEAGTLVTLDGSGSMDPDGDLLTYSWSGPFGSASGVSPTVNFQKGTSYATLTVSDGKEDSVPDNVMITIQDTTPPEITCPSNITVNNDSGVCGAVVIYTTTASDSCDGNSTITCTPASGSTFDVGTTTVNCKATDSSGNTASCSFDVTVVDNELPVISCNAPGTIIPPTSPITFRATATDNCSDPVTVVIKDFDCYTFTKKGKKIDMSDKDDCQMQVKGDTITILESVGVNMHIKWTIEATDKYGNVSTETWDLMVVKPGR